MLRRWRKALGSIAVLAIIGAGSLVAQQPPDTILYNGKIITVDDPGVNGNLGTTAQAIAVREGKIVAVGANTAVRQLAGNSTKSYDLKGRTVIPALAATHDHPTDWDPLNPYIVKKVVSDDLIIERFLEDPPDQQLQKFPRVLDEAVQKAKPGQWIRISMLFGRGYRWGDEISGFLGRQINKQMLDMAAPNNPVIVRAGFVGMLANQKAMDAVKKFYGGEFEKFEQIDSPVTKQMEQRGYCAVCYREFEQDVMYPAATLREIYRLGLSWWAGYGLGMNGSNMYTAGAMTAYDSLDRKGEMAIRLPWTYFWPERKDFGLDPYFRAFVVSMKDRGSDYFWLNGAIPSDYGRNCTTLPGTSPEVKQSEGACRFDPDSPVGKLNTQVMYEFIKSGGRYAGAHMVGDKEIDYVLDIIERASKDAGMTPDQVRDKRHTWDHLGLNPRPDQIPRIKNLGMVMGGWDISIWEGDGQQFLKDYGEQALQWMIPRKSLLEAGIRQSIEIDRPLGYTDLTFFTVLHTAITRKDKDGVVITPTQSVSREVILKSATLSGAYYAEKEKILGSLETGKLADLTVLDRDYLTIPVDDIPNIRTIMTMVGGKIVHLVPSLAREFGVQPVGAQVELGGPASKW